MTGGRREGGITPDRDTESRGSEGGGSERGGGGGVANRIQFETMRGVSVVFTLTHNRLGNCTKS